jgi:magnesium transporter
VPTIEDKRQQILQALAQNKIDQALSQLNHFNVADQASILASLSLEQRVHLFQQLHAASEVMSFLTLEQQIELTEQLPIASAVNILDGMHSDDFIDVFKRLNTQLQQQLIQKLSIQSLAELKLLAAYVEGTAGALMSANYMTLAAELTMDQALQHLRTAAGEQDTLYLIYVVNTQNQLIGVISLREMIQAAPEATISETMQHDVIVGHVFDDQENIAKILAYYDFIALPIVDDAQHLLGIVTYDDAMDILRDEATEDMFKSSAVTPLEHQSIKTAPILRLYRSRVFWLVILVFGSLLSGFGIAHFEDLIAENIVLVFFLPLLVGSGGNAGSQSATLMVRALATGDVQMKDWFMLLGRETFVALCLGGTMAVAVSILGYFRGDIMVAVVLALSMLGIVMMGCLIGMSLPFILKQLKLDPASASAPLVTSICDATGVVVYLFIASQLLL